MFVYKIKVNSYQYFGMTDNIQKRYNRHYNDLVKGSHHNPILQRSFNKNIDFNLEIVKECSSRKEASELEKNLILTEECVNIALGGDGGDTISNHPNKKNIIEKIKNTRSKIQINFSDKFIESQGSLSKRADIVWGNYKCGVCSRVIKGKSNFLRYHGDKCGKPRDKWFNNGIEEKLLAECPDGWYKGRLK